MRTFKRNRAEGFTLVELMIVVAIIGVLAALAVFGVNRYLGSARSAEAKQNIGSIARAAAAAFERESQTPALLAAGGTGNAQSRSLCASATASVPAAVASVSGKKYQPDAASTGADFNLGDSTTGWSCLRYNIDQPMQYSVYYTAGTYTNIAGGVTRGTILDAPGSTGFLASAVGDTDADGQYSAFGRQGSLLSGSGSASTLTVGTDVQIVNEYE